MAVAKTVKVSLCMMCLSVVLVVLRLGLLAGCRRCFERVRGTGFAYGVLLERV